MSEKSTSVQIRILDKEYHINCPPSDQEALMKSARYLDESMRKVKERGNIHGSEKVAVMAALNITYELLQKNRLINESPVASVVSRSTCWKRKSIRPWTAADSWKCNRLPAHLCSESGLTINSRLY